jgi:Secretion system C-terminal sorting domain
MKIIYTFFLTVLLFAHTLIGQTVTNGVSVLNVQKGTETATDVEFTFTLTMTPAVTNFYSANFRIDFTDLTNPTQVNVAGPTNYTTSITTGGGLVLNCVFDAGAYQTVSTVTWTVNFTKTAANTTCLTIVNTTNEVLDSDSNEYPAAITNNCNIVLPVQLTQFQGQNHGNSHILTWQTASEKDNAGFYIEQSNDGKAFKTIGFVKGFGSTSDKQTYTFTNRLSPLSIAYYRLRQESTVRQITYSKTIAVVTDDKKPKKTLSIYPNPANSVIDIDYSANLKSLSVYNLQGKKLMQMAERQADISLLKAGIYILEAVDTEGVVSTTKFVKN